MLVTIRGSGVLCSKGERCVVILKLKCERVLLDGKSHWFTFGWHNCDFEKG